MRIHKNKGISKKRCLRTMGVLLASVMVVSSGEVSYVFADSEGKKTEISDEKEEKRIIYLNGKSGKDSNSGESSKKAVRTFEQAAKLSGDYGVIRICGTVTVKGNEVWELPSGVSVRRAENFEGFLVKVEGSLVLDNVRMFAEDITGDGSIEGAVEKEKVYVPKKLVMDEPMELSELPLTKCEGDGVFSWADETFIPSEYETECKVIFYPYDTKTVDYSKEKGWDEEKERIVRTVLVQVTSLKSVEEAPVEPTPEVTPGPTVEPTPEVTPGQPLPEQEKPTEQQPVLTPEEIQAAAQVQNQIDYLPTEVTAIEVVEAIIDASQSYQALSEAQKGCLAADAYDKLLQAQERAAVFNRQSNGVTIEGDFPWYVQFRVELKNEQEDVSVLEDYNVDTFITPYDMVLWDLMSDTEYSLNGQQVKVTIPAPDKEIYTQLVIVHYMDDGSVEYITPVYNNDGTMSFITTSFSPYNLAGTKIAGSKPLVGNIDKAYPSKPSGQNTLTGGSSNSSSGTPAKRPNSTGSRPNTTGKKPSSSSGNKGNTVTTWVPQTGDEQMPFQYVGMGAAALAVLIFAGTVIVIKRRKKM